MPTLLLALRILGWTCLVVSATGFAWLALVLYGAAQQHPGPQTQVDADPNTATPPVGRATQPRKRIF